MEIKLSRILWQLALLVGIAEVDLAIIASDLSAAVWFSRVFSLIGNCQVIF